MMNRLTFMHLAYSTVFSWQVGKHYKIRVVDRLVVDLKKWKKYDVNLFFKASKVPKKKFDVFC